MGVIPSLLHRALFEHILCSGEGVGSASSKALLCETHSDALTISFLEVLFFLTRGQQKPEEGCPSREFWALGH